MCYNLGLSNKAKEKPCIGFISENSIEFQLQSVYLIHTRLIVCIILNLAYSKEYVYYMLLIYSIISLFQNLLHSSVTCDHMTDMWYHIESKP